MTINEELKIKIWIKGHFILGKDPAYWRKDDYGAIIFWNHYGNRNSEYGWEVDHITPVSIGGSDHESNLRPLYWRLNVARN